MTKLVIVVAMVIAWIGICNGSGGQIHEGNVCQRTEERTELEPETRNVEINTITYVASGECGCETTEVAGTAWVDRTEYVEVTRYDEYEECCEGWCGEYCDIPLCDPQCLEGGSCVEPDLCTCPEGFVYTEDGCEDIDECDTENYGGCEHECVNTPGSYHCECDEEYALNDDGYTCDYLCGEVNSKCIGCSRYQIFTANAETQEIRWLDAKLECERRGGVLAMLKTDAINTEVRHYITSHDLHLEVDKGFWFGLKDLAEEGVYRWMDGDILEDGGFSYWADGNPNNNQNNGEDGQDCVQLWTVKNLKWDDNYCFKKRGYICEFNICDIDDAS